MALRLKKYGEKKVVKIHLGFIITILNTVTFDLGGVCGLHTTLSNIFEPSEINLPPFPDPFEIETMEKDEEENEIMEREAEEEAEQEAEQEAEEEGILVN